MLQFEYNDLFDGPNPINERIVLSQITTLEVDAGWRDMEATQQFLDVLRGQFDALGYSHISLKAVHKLRRGMIIIDGIIYKVTTGQMSNDAALKFMRDLKRKMEPIIHWCNSNCTGKFALDENGLSFTEEGDYLLFKMWFAKPK